MCLYRYVFDPIPWYSVQRGVTSCLLSCSPVTQLAIELIAAEITAVSKRAGMTLDMMRSVARRLSRSIDGQNGSVLMWPL